MADNALTAAVRENAGKGVARKLRATGRIPGVFYGNAREPLAISLDPQELEHLLAESDAGMNTLIDLTVKGNGDGGTTLVLVKDIQRDPIRGIALHADLLAIDVSKTITATIPIRVEGTASGVSVSDGILDQALRDLHARGRDPRDADLDPVGLRRLGERVQAGPLAGRLHLRAGSRRRRQGEQETREQRGETTANRPHASTVAAVHPAPP